MECDKLEEATNGLKTEDSVLGQSGAQLDQTDGDMTIPLLQLVQQLLRYSAEYSKL